MGFYLRKSVNLGAGVRLNLSSGGLGLSAGVKGLRVGMNGRGTYVHMGRGGLYYRQQFSYKPSRRPAARQSRPRDDAPILSGDPPSTNLVAPIDVESAAVNKEHVLRHFRSETQPAKIVAAFLGAISLFVLGVSQAAGLGLFVLAALAFGYSILAQNRGVLVYNLEDLALERFESLVAAFDAYFASDRTWLFETRTPTYDWKRNAGAGNLIKRISAIATSNEDKRLRTNISVPRLIAGKNRIYFLPDLVVVQEASGEIKALEYVNLDLEHGRCTFIEEEGVAGDAQVIGQTWRFVRRDGGPDRRFNNNRQLPICSYQQTVFITAGSASRTIVQTRPADGRAFRERLLRMRDQIVTVSATESPAPLAIAYQPAA